MPRSSDDRHKRSSVFTLPRADLAKQFGPDASKSRLCAGHWMMLADFSLPIAISLVRVADNSPGTINRRLEIEYPGRIFAVIPVGQFGRPSAVAADTPPDCRKFDRALKTHTRPVL